MHRAAAPRFVTIHKSCLSMAGLPALHGSEPGQVRKEAATAIYCKCRGSGSPPHRCGGRRAGVPVAVSASRMNQSFECTPGSCPQMAPAQLRSDGRAGARGAGADQCAEAEPSAPRLPDDRHARRRQDDAGAHHGQGAQLRDWRYCRALRQVFCLRRRSTPAASWI